MWEPQRGTILRVQDRAVSHVVGDRKDSETNDSSRSRSIQVSQSSCCGDQAAERLILNGDEPGNPRARSPTAFGRAPPRAAAQFRSYAPAVLF